MTTRIYGRSPFAECFVWLGVAAMIAFGDATAMAQGNDRPVPTPMGRGLRERAEREARERARQDSDGLPRPSMLDEPTPKPTAKPTAKPSARATPRVRRNETTRTLSTRESRTTVTRERTRDGARATEREGAAERKPERAQDAPTTATRARGPRSVVREGARLNSGRGAAAVRRDDPRAKVDPSVARVAARMMDPAGTRRRRLDAYGLWPLGGRPVTLFLAELPVDRIAEYLRDAAEQKRSRALRAMATLDDLDAEKRVNRERALRNLGVMRIAGRLSPVGESSVQRLHSAAMRVAATADSRPWLLEPALYMALARSASQDTMDSLSSRKSSEQASLSHKGALDAAAVFARARGPRRALTVSTYEAARATQQLVLEARAPSAEAAAGLAQIDALVANWNRRKTLKQMSLPPPSSGEPGGVAAGLPGPMPEEPTTGAHRAPADEKVAPPRARGLEIMAKAKGRVHAAAKGTVVFAGEVRGLGNAVILEHDGGLFSVYANLAEVSVAESVAVTAGARLGVLGDTLPDGARAETLPVHFEVRRGDAVVPVAELIGNANPNELILEP